MTDRGETEQPDQSDPTNLRVGEIFRSLTTSQLWGVASALVALFIAGYAIGQWSSSTSHQREMATLEEAHRQELVGKENTVSVRDTTISTLKDDLAKEKINTTNALDVASAADQSAQRFEAKSEFLHRYVSYLEAPDSNMRRLFSSHVCVLWREAQRDILTRKSDEFTLQEVSRGRLTSLAVEALAERGVSREMVRKYAQLNRDRADIQRRVRKGTRVGPLRRADRRAEAQLRELQGLDKSIGNALGGGLTTKTVTFFDGTTYQIPQEIADDVHQRTDCQA